MRRMLKPLGAELREIGKHIADRNGIDAADDKCERLAGAAIVEWYLDRHGDDFERTHEDRPFYVFTGEVDTPPIDVEKAAVLRREGADTTLEPLHGDTGDTTRSTDGEQEVASVGDDSSGPSFEL